MPNCRSISPEAWAHARESLIFYFSSRHGRFDAEDLAHETLLAIWNREDYEFEKEEDCLKVCRGFAERVSRQGFRKALRHNASALPDEALFAAPQQRWGSPRATESALLLTQVLKIGKSQMDEK